MLATFSKPQRPVTSVTDCGRALLLIGLGDEASRVHPAAILCWPAANAEGCSARSRSPLAPLHAAAGMGGRGSTDDRGGGGHRVDRLRGPALPGRCLLALVQRPR